MNFAFMSSSEPTYKSTYNPTGAPFRDYKDNQSYAQKLPAVGADLSPSLDANTAAAMQNLLGDFGEFGYVGDSTTNPWGSSALIDLVKAVRADQDTDSHGHLLDFSTTRLAQASNGAASATDEGGWVEYQLSLTNNAGVKRTGIAIADILPQIGDTQNTQGVPRGSQWQVYFNSVESVKVNGTATSNYKVYVYTGAVGDAYVAINEALNKWRSGHD